MTDFELEQVCRSVVENEENHFAISLHKRGKTGLPYLVMQVMRKIPKDEMNNDVLVKIHQILVRFMDTTSN